MARLLYNKHHISEEDIQQEQELHKLRFPNSKRTRAQIRIDYLRTTFGHKLRTPLKHKFNSQLVSNSFLSDQAYDSHLDERLDLKRAINKALNESTPKQRQAAIMLMLGYTLSDISKHFKVNPSSTKYKIDRFKERLLYHINKC